MWNISKTTGGLHRVKSSGLQKVMVERFPSRSASDIDQRCRLMRKAPTGKRSKRGFGAEELSMGVAASHLLAVVPPRLGGLADFIDHEVQLRYVRHPNLPLEHHPMPPGYPLAGAMIAAMIKGRPWTKFEIAEDGRFAWLEWRVSPVLPTYRFMFTSDYDQYIAANPVLGTEDEVPVDELLALFERYEEADRSISGGRFTFSCSFLAEVGAMILRDLPDDEDDLEPNELAARVKEHTGRESRE